MKHILAVTLTLLLAACGSVPGGLDPTDEQSVALQTTVEFDSHENLTRIKAPWARTQARDKYMLRSITKQPGEFYATQLYISARFDRWAFLDRAHSEGRRLDVTEVAREVDRHPCGTGYCTVREDIAVNLTMGELREIAKKPMFVVKVSGAKGYILVDVPSAYIKGFLTTAEWTH
jgi:hypothetical protein